MRRTRSTGGISLEIDIRVGDDTPEGTRLSCTITNHGKTVLKLRGTVCEMP